MRYYLFTYGAFKSRTKELFLVHVPSTHYIAYIICRVVVFKFLFNVTKSNQLYKDKLRYRRRGARKSKDIIINYYPTESIMNHELQPHYYFYVNKKCLIYIFVTITLNFELLYLVRTIF